MFPYYILNLSHPLLPPGEGNGNPLQYSCLENPVDRGAWWATVHGVTQSQTWLKRLSMHACIGEGNGNPLQCACLEDPRDRGAWWAAIYGVPQSRTQLKQLSSSSSSLPHCIQKSESPLLLCKKVHQYHLSVFHIYVLIYNVYFPLSDLLHSV